MKKEKQIEEMAKTMQKSNAVTYEPNAYKIHTYADSLKNKFFVSDQNGHLTIDYRNLAADLYNEGCRMVVMCKDCIHRVKDDVGRSYCEFTDTYCGDDCYCNYGERE